MVKAEMDGDGIPDTLSEREAEILRLVATGASNKEIAQRLYISSNTVKVHLRNIFSKIGAASRTEAAMYAVRIGLVQAAPGALPDQETESSIAISSETSATPTDISTASVEQASGVLRRRPLLRWGQRLGLTLVGLLILGAAAIGLSRQDASLPPPTPTLEPTTTALPRWVEQARLPTARAKLALAALENQLYAIGGETTQGVSGVVERYDIQNDRWLTLAAKPLPVAEISAAVIGGKIYVPGGRLASGKPTNVLEIYDPRTDTWEQGAALPRPLSGYAMVAFEGHLYVFGGWDGENYLDTVYAYDPSLDAWTVKTPMPTRRAFCGAAEANGMIFVIGGYDGKKALTVNEIYQPSRDDGNDSPWRIGFALPDGRQGVQVTAIADAVYVLGGATQTASRFGLIYFPQTNTWQSLEASPWALGAYFGMVSIGTHLYIVGGETEGIISDQNLTYQALITLSIPIIIK